MCNSLRLWLYEVADSAPRCSKSVPKVGAQQSMRPSIPPQPCIFYTHLNARRPHQSLADLHISLLFHCQPPAGTPCVFYDHFYQEQGGLRQNIIQLIKLRKKHGINARWVAWHSHVHLSLACLQITHRRPLPLPSSAPGAENLPLTPTSCAQGACRTRPLTPTRLPAPP